jgi:DNA mismatch repair protein MutS
MLAQYMEIRQAHPDCLLFYRMGDFYEMFFDDAVAAAAALDITLTRRGRHDGEDIPMCGVPVHNHESYLLRLIRQNFRVAICEQIEDPAEARKRGGKTVVRRAVTRVVTPGTLTEDTLLDARSHNFLVALAEIKGAEIKGAEIKGAEIQGNCGLACLDLSTGDLTVERLRRDTLAAGLARLDPGEILVSDLLVQEPALFELFAEWKPRLTVQPPSRFDSENGRRRLEDLYGVGTLDAFGGFERAEIAAAGALVDYIALTQKGRMPRLLPPRRLVEGASMQIDAATRRNLELVRSVAGERRGSLLASLDRTITGPGARLLATWLAAPLTQPKAIAHRLDMVDFARADRRLRGEVRGLLRRCPDMERALSRLTLGRGGPRDLAAIRDGLRAALDLRRMLGADQAGGGLGPPPAGITGAVGDLGDHAGLIDRLGRALAADLPLHTRDGGFINRGYAGDLDDLISLRDESRQLIAGLQARYAAEAGIPTLKIRHNHVLGYFIEVSPAQGDKLIAAGGVFIHRQTMAGAMRFATAELGSLDRRIAEAADKALAVELALFETLVTEVAARADTLARAARALALLDVVFGLGDVADDKRWCRPVVDDSLAFTLTGGRHPVVEAALEGGGGGFIANDADLGPDRRLWLLTGPNMAGKSTFLRQNAVIAILAQTGSFVPADACHLGAVDRLYSRVGAADDLARGRSTFMVEMVETAAILNTATPRSLVILDEIGRGTATFDGLSIAWAAVEHLHDVTRCRGLFATHYHELTALAARLPALACHTMRVKEWQGEVVFLHEVAPGSADRSYGIHVARLAGLPAAVIARAETVLKLLESGRTGTGVSRLVDDLPLFTVAVRRAEPPPSPVDAALRGLEPDSLSPREALDALYRLKEIQRNST